MRMQLIHGGKRKEMSTGAFSRFDLLVTIVIVVVVALLAGGLLKLRSKVKLGANASQCMSNLKEIGTAMQLYFADNEQRLPYAGIRKGPGMHYTWDDLLNARLGGKFTQQQLFTSDPTNDMPVLRCPADMEEINPKNGKLGSHRRTYSMIHHDMLDANWPPSENNKTGVGLLWDVGSSSINRMALTRWEPVKKMNSPFDKFREPSVNTSMVLKPAETLLATERPFKNNVIGCIVASTIQNVSQHVDVKSSLDPATYHDNRFNYLFIDGHVENLDPIKTVGTKNTSPAIPSGMWTIDATD